MKTTVKNAQPEDMVNIGISVDNRGAVAKMLKQLLADEHVLYIKLRNYHWNVEGMYFQQLHDLFSTQYTALEEHIDDIAERVRQLGEYSPGSMAAFRELSRLQESDDLGGNDRLMLQNILADHEMIIQVLRQDLDAALEEYNDAGTADFFTALMQVHEKMAWLVRAHLK